MRQKIDREQRLKDEISKNSSVLHRVVKITDGLDAVTRLVLYCGRDRQEARRVYHSVVCNKNDTISNEIVFDAGGNDFRADAVIETFSVKWSGRK